MRKVPARENVKKLLSIYMCIFVIHISHYDYKLNIHHQLKKNKYFITMPLPKQHVCF